MAPAQDQQLNQIQDSNNDDDTIADINDQTVNPNLGDHIEVCWPLDNQYYPGVVKNVDENGQNVISYADGDEEQLVMKDETWRFINNTFNSKSA